MTPIQERRPNGRRKIEKKAAAPCFEMLSECAERTIWGELKFLDHPHGSVMKSLKVSVDALPASQDETLPDKLLAHIAPLGSDHISVCFRSQDGR